MVSRFWNLCIIIDLFQKATFPSRGGAAEPPGGVGTLTTNEIFFLAIGIFWYRIICVAPIAQLDKASDYGSED